MKKSFYALLAASTLLVGNSWGQFVANLDDLNYWGSGANKSAFVVYWNDAKGPDALAWGFQWDTPGTTVADMLLFLAANDPKLFARIDSSTGFGLGIFGLGYQNGPSPFGISGAEDGAGNTVSPVFIGGVDDINTNLATTQAPFSSAAAQPLNPDDRYKEGWNDNGFWEMYNSGVDNLALEASFALPTTWTSSWVGSSTTLVNNSWAAFSISNPDFSSNLPTTSVVSAIPESATAGLVLIGLGAIWLRRHRPA